jgi:hypothetical protein
VSRSVITSVAVIFVVDEALHDAVEERVRRLEAGDQELLDAVADVAREQRGQHRQCALCGERGVASRCAG